MTPSPVERLLGILHSWEAEYGEVRHQLRMGDVYVLWLSLFRISRQIMVEYQDRVRRGEGAEPQRAYTGKTRRLH